MRKIVVFKLGVLGIIAAIVLAGCKKDNTQEALDRGVFGAPTYAYKDELFWGQDRLDFLARALES